ncbi:MAG: fibrobacter succinogenes major paralogous domain-containing protein [Mariniphaga sp.]|nr:fibrobacter succinogenes major paralogous domain-containing protein [Mariniphaga sp.]
MKRAAFISVIFLSIFISKAEGQDFVKDIDGNEYQTIKIGDQIWMAENLRVTHDQNGEAIPNVQDSKQWGELTSGAFCDVRNDPAKSDRLGRLYNWYVSADNRNVCPAGWHIPSAAEWQVLTKFLAENPDGKLLNKKIFEVLQEDYRGFNGDFLGNGYGGGGWWTSTPITSGMASYYGINYNTAGKIAMEGRKTFGYSIRCIKD